MPLLPTPPPLVISGGQEWNPVETCSLDTRTVCILLECFLVSVFVHLELRYKQVITKVYQVLANCCQEQRKVAEGLRAFTGSYAYGSDAS